jgi:hypothetical protein
VIFSVGLEAFVVRVDLRIEPFHRCFFLKSSLKNTIVPFPPRL